MSSEEAEGFLTDASGVKPYHWVAVTLDPLISDDQQVLGVARQKLTEELRQSFNAEPDVALLLPVEAAGELLETTFGGTPEGAVVMVLATVWKLAQDGEEPGDVRQVPLPEWTNDEWFKVMRALKPDTPRSVAEAAVASWREEAEE
ncbi:hypothetical protein [Actinomadura kijaniata]|uniref:hypothetical protein n=1 Tax=Actinomadura kijaniata TaxID=46161 RepID=UPI0012FAC711|nr:hypothetical protein [Actinomadura kijaniata]